MLRTLNLGILAHVDAGKTSLTERLLYAAGVIDTIGRVDDGNTQTDSLALERQRGITIKAAVVSFSIGDVTVNLIDTPGHPDFIAEVDRVLGVLDGAVLVVSAVEGVQPQTRILMRALRRLGIPTLIFVNKIDRRGARGAALVREIADKLTPAVVAMGRADGLGTRAAAFRPYAAGDRAHVTNLLDLLAEDDEALLTAYVNEPGSVTPAQLCTELAAQSRRGRVHPIFFGSAITGAGLDTLTDAITTLLPVSAGDPEGPPAGSVFKVERGKAGDRIAYVRLASGSLDVRERIDLGGGTAPKITAISVFADGRLVPRQRAVAGQIAKVWGLGDIQIGAAIGSAGPSGPAAAGQFPRPTLETVVVPRVRSERGALHLALVQLAEQDPLINLRHDEARQETSVSLYGEVQKEVIEATLATEFGIEVSFLETTTICIERPIAIGEAFELIYKAPNPFLATVGLRIEPTPVGSGIEIQLGVELGSMPYAFFKAVEDTVRDTLRQGLRGWDVADCLVTITHSGYAPRQSHSHARFDKSMSSTGADFRGLTPLVLMAALKAAGTRVYEPVHAFRAEVPADSYGSLLPVLAQLQAIPRLPTARGASYVIEGDIPAARLHELETRLPTLTSGEGVLESSFDHYQPVSGTPPSRRRTDHNPLNRKEYLRQLARGLAPGEELP